MNRTIVKVSPSQVDKPMTIYEGTSGEVFSMAYDPDLDLVYWTDALYSWLLVGSIRSGNLTTVAIDTGLMQPYQVLLAISKG